jgi:hypothetical protein
MKMKRSLIVAVGLMLLIGLSFGSYAATKDLRLGTAGAAPAATFSGKTYVVDNVIDFAAHHQTAADVVQLVNVPKGYWVPSGGVRYVVDTVEGGTLTFDIGDAGDTDGYVDGANGDGDNGDTGSSKHLITLSEGTPNTYVDVGYTNGRYYTAAGVISLIPVNTADAAKITVKVVMIDLN